MNIKWKDIESKSTNLAINHQAIKNSIKNILLTPIGSFPGDPRFGSNILKLVFQPIDDYIRGALEEAIILAINNYEPRITILDIIIQPVPEYNKVIIKIIYHLNDDDQSLTETFKLGIDLG